MALLPEPPPDDGVSHLRVPPHSVEAEQSVLGALLLDNTGWDRVGDLLTEKDFYRYEHRLIYAAIGKLITATRPADIITVLDQLRRAGHDQEAGGLGYLNSLSASEISAANIRKYAEIVRGRAMLREMIVISDEVATQAFSLKADAPVLLDRLLTRLGALERHEADRQPVQLDKLIVAELDRIQQMAESGEGTPQMGISTGLPALDRLIRGLQGGKVYLLGARPGIGKTALAVKWLLQASDVAFEPGLILSQEMPKPEITIRFLASAGGINTRHLEDGNLSTDEWGRLSEATDRLRSIPLHIDDQAALTLQDIRMKARFVRGVKLIVLDYVQLCAGAHEDEKESTRNQVLEAISRGLKEIAKELNCAVVVLSALNRAVDEIKFGRARMKDYKDCGALEADADVIMSLFKIRKLQEQEGDLIGVDVLKHRAGPTGSVALNFWKPVMQWGSTDYVVEDLLESGSKPLRKEL